MMYNKCKIIQFVKGIFMGEKACCFIGRSCILSKKEFRPQICAVVESLIVESKWIPLSLQVQIRLSDYAVML